MRFAFWMLIAIACVPGLIVAAPAPYPITVESQSDSAPNLILHAASPRTIRVTFQDGGTAANVSGDTPFMAWATNSTAGAVSTATWAYVNSGTNGVVDFTFSASALNHDAGRYIYEVGLTSNSAATVVRQGTLLLRASPYGSGVDAIDWTTIVTWGTFDPVGWPYLLPAATSVLARTSDLAAYVPTSRTVTAGAGLTGGGALDANVTLAVDAGVTSSFATVTYSDAGDVATSNYVGAVSGLVVSVAAADATTKTNALRTTYDADGDGVYDESASVTFEVRNVSGAPLTRGKAVYESGYNVGLDLIEVSAADATVDAQNPAVGLVASDIGNNASGRVVEGGKLADWDTSAWSAGDSLYLWTGGTLTNAKPVGASVHVQYIGSVLRSHLSAGIVLVQMGAPDNLPNLDAGQILYGGPGDTDRTNLTAVAATAAQGALADTALQADATGALATAYTAADSVLSGQIAGHETRIDRLEYIDLDIALALDAASLSTPYYFVDTFNAQGLGVDETASTGETWANGYYAWSIFTAYEFSAGALRWPMDDNAANTAVDETQAGYDAVLAGGDNTSVISVDGLIGSALDLDGSADYVDTQTNMHGVITGDWSLSLWFKPDDGQPAVTEDLFSASNAGANNRILIQLQADGSFRPLWQDGGSAVNFISAAGTLSDGAQGWHHLVVCASSVSNADYGIHCYLDGSVLAPKDAASDGNTSVLNSPNFSAMAPGVSFYIGARNTGGSDSQHFAGLIDEVKIWTNTIISSSQASSLYNSGAGRENFSGAAGGQMRLVSSNYIGTATSSTVKVVIDMDDGGTDLTASGLGVYVSDDALATSNAVSMTRDPYPRNAATNVSAYRGEANLPGNGTNYVIEVYTGATNTSGKVRGWAVGRY